MWAICNITRGRVDPRNIKAALSAHRISILHSNAISKQSLPVSNDFNPVSRSALRLGTLQRSAQLSSASLKVPLVRERVRQGPILCAYPASDSAFIQFAADKVSTRFEQHRVPRQTFRFGTGSRKGYRIDERPGLEWAPYERCAGLPKG